MNTTNIMRSIETRANPQDKLHQTQVRSGSERRIHADRRKEERTGEVFYRRQQRERRAI